MTGEKCFFHPDRHAVAYNNNNNPVCSECLDAGCKMSFNSPLAVKNSCRREERDDIDSVPIRVLEAIDEYQEYGK